MNVLAVRFALASLACAPLASTGSAAPGSAGPAPAPSGAPQPEATGTTETAGAAGSATADGWDYEAMAEAVLVTLGYAPSDAGELTMERVFAERFFRVQLGAVDLLVPGSDLSTTDRVKEFQRAAQAVIAVQLQWLEWVPPPGAPAGDGRGGGAELDPAADLELLAKWVDSWNPGKLRLAKIEEERDLALVLEPSAAQRRALDAAASYFTGGAGLTVDDGEHEPTTVAVLPTRTQFCELAALAGMLDPANTGLFWREDLGLWTEARVGDARMLALKYPVTTGRKWDYAPQVRMDEKEKTGLEQYVAERAALSLLSMAFGERMPEAFAAGFAIHLVIGAYGEDNVRTEGDLRGRSVPPMEVFIPGATSDGSLPAPNLDGKWRDKKGSDHFLLPLAASQKTAWEAEREKQWKDLSFQIRGENENGEWIAHAPFLGSAARGRTQPEPHFLGDYREFFRAYKAAFVHYLTSAAAGKPRDSKAAFASFLGELAAAESAEEFEACAARAYGRTAFCDAAASAGTLEGDFLRWLAD
jgi:hypothetical protein